MKGADVPDFFGKHIESVKLTSKWAKAGKTGTVTLREHCIGFVKVIDILSILDMTMLDFDSNVLRTRLKILMLVTKQQMDATKFGSRMLKNGLWPAPYQDQICWQFLARFEDADLVAKTAKQQIDANRFQSRTMWERTVNLLFGAANQTRRHWDKTGGVTCSVWSVECKV